MSNPGESDMSRRRFPYYALRGMCIITLFCVVASGTNNVAQSRNTSPAWASQRNYRVLVKIDPVDIGKRAGDEMPAEIILDLTAKLRALGAKLKANLATVQVVKYDPKTGTLVPYGHYAYGSSRFDRPFRWYDSSIPYE